jgi:hypothetical protein
LRRTDQAPSRPDDTQEVGSAPPDLFRLRQFFHSHAADVTADRATDGRSMDELRSRTLPGFGVRVQPQVSARKDLLGYEVE